MNDNNTIPILRFSFRSGMYLVAPFIPAEWTKGKALGFLLKPSKLYIAAPTSVFFIQDGFGMESEKLIKQISIILDANTEKIKRLWIRLPDVELNIDIQEDCYIIRPEHSEDYTIFLLRPNEALTSLLS